MKQFRIKYNGLKKQFFYLHDGTYVVNEDVYYYTSIIFCFFYFTIIRTYEIDK